MNLIRLWGRLSSTSPGSNNFTSCLKPPIPSELHTGVTMDTLTPVHHPLLQLDMMQLPLGRLQAQRTERFNFIHAILVQYRSRHFNTLPLGFS